MSNWYYGQYEDHSDLCCSGCQQLFQLSDKHNIYILHLGTIRRDYCQRCRNKIIAFIDNLAIEDTEEQVSVIELTSSTLHHEKAYQ